MEILSEIASQPLTGTIIGGALASGAGLLTSYVMRRHDRIQQKLNRSFDLKVLKYTDYTGLIDSLLKRIYEYQEQGIDPQAAGLDVEHVPDRIVQAQLALQLVATKSIRSETEKQLRLLPSAMSLDEATVRELQQSQDDLIELIQNDLGLDDDKH
ncbi:hypothetical protein [Brevibacterium samyangense]|uniref:Uncharacterized protein n=1 Tax=Brevibacterium samyangense TaxID=366888 RepID=A0ABP5EEV6_9MICO